MFKQPAAPRRASSKPSVQTASRPPVRPVAKVATGLAKAKPTASDVLAKVQSITAVRNGGRQPGWVDDLQSFVDKTRTTGDKPAKRSR